MRGSARSHEIELLADELNRLVGWGVEPSRLATKRVLRELAEVDESLSRITAGCVIERYIRGQIRSFSGSRMYLKREYDAHVLKQAFMLQLGIERSNLSAPARQYRLMQVLELDYTYDQWRRSPRLQRGLLTLLAEAMTVRQT